MLYYCKPPNIVVATHADEQLLNLDPIEFYGIGCYVLIDYRGSPSLDANKNFVYPTVTALMQSDSVKYECKRRILLKASEQSQRNMNAHVGEIQTSRMSVSPIRPATPAEQADMNTYNAIFNWIGRPNGMQGASDNMISAGDLEWYQDVKWPQWDPAPSQGWDAFVLRF